MPVNVTFAGLGANDKPPATALYRLDANGAPAEKLGSVSGGALGVDPAKLKGLQIAVGPDTDDPKALDPASLLRFRGDQVIADWARNGLIIPKDRWPIFWGEQICVSGHVKKCRPWWYDLVVKNAIQPKIGVQLRAQPARFGDISAANIALPWRCLPVCDGIVEIWEKVCCCTIIDWDDLAAKLRAALRDIPVLIDWPVPPIPDPGPLHTRIGDLSRINTGLNTNVRPMPLPPMRTLAANRAPDLAQTTVSQRVYDDYRALLKTPRDQVDSFVKARPYLSAYCCTCATRKVGETPIRPGGDFDFCYRRIPHIIGIRQICYTVFAYRVKQQIGGVWTYVYDGVAGHDYFAQGDVAELHTSNPAARPCGDGPTPPDPGDGTNFVMLEHVTGAGTHHFNWPVQSALSQVGALGSNSGLYNFGGVPDCPWASGLGLRLWVSPGLEGTVAYYRFKVVAVNAAGAATGPVTILGDPVAWQRYVTVSGDVITTSTGLNANPADVGGQEGLIAVPYWSHGMDWLSGQYHQGWDTTKFGDGKYMLILELFGPGGARIKPASAPAGDPGAAKPFQLRRWHAPGDTDNVPFADCAHVFWLNNRPVSGDIVDLRKNGVASTDECQFMSGPSNTTFSTGFRAFHLDGVTTGGGAGDTDSFMASYALTWQRGLNGPSGTLETGTADKGEAGAVQSNTMTFGTLLGAFPPASTAHTRCSFSVHLHVDAKHHNGGGFIDAYDYDETASFALELIP